MATRPRSAFGSVRRALSTAFHRIQPGTPPAGGNSVLSGLRSRVGRGVLWTRRAMRTGEVAPVARAAVATAPPGPSELNERVALVAVLLRHLLEQGPEGRAALNAHGLDAVLADHYSPMPTVREIEGSFEYRPGAPPYADSGLFDAELLKSFLLELMPFAQEFDPPQEGSPEGGRFFWGNAMFGHADAMAYYCMLRHLKPRRVVEVGSGFSTMVAAEALERNGSGSIVCVEPFPPPFLDRVPRVERVIASPVQDVAASFFDESLADGDVLFIDSTHTVKAGGDCVYLYLKALPAVRSRIVVHAHDIFLPEAYPQAWLLDRRFYWAEQYLVHALLSDNPRYQVVYGSTYHKHYNPDLLGRLMAGKAGAGGASLWFRRV